MCDYSLEIYRSRPAVYGEQYTLYRFRTGTLGFVKPGEEGTAVCMPTGAHLHLESLDKKVLGFCGIADVEDAVMIRLPFRGNTHRDGLKFTNGREVLLQALHVGLCARLASRDLVELLGLDAETQHDRAKITDCGVAEASLPPSALHTALSNAGAVASKWPWLQHLSSVFSRNQPGHAASSLATRQRTAWRALVEM